MTTSEPQPLAFQADLIGGAFVLTLTVVLLTLGAVSASDKPYVMNHAVASSLYVAVPPAFSSPASCYAAVDDLAPRVYHPNAGAA